MALRKITPAGLTTVTLQTTHLTALAIRLAFTFRTMHLKLPYLIKQKQGTIIDNYLNVKLSALSKLTILTIIMNLAHVELQKEILALPEFVRFTFSYQDDSQRYLTLSIKAHSLLLKYIIQGVPLRLLFFATSDGQCVYVLQIEDDPGNSARLWSVLAYEGEVATLRALEKHPECSIYLINVTCRSCAWTPAMIAIDSSALAIVNASPADNPNPDSGLNVC